MGSQKLKKSLHRAFNRGSILSVLEKETLLTGIKVYSDGYFSTETKDWGTYWQPVYKLDQKKQMDFLMFFITRGENTLMPISFLRKGKNSATDIFPFWGICCHFKTRFPLRHGYALCR
jgi:hypothetical protein